MRLLLSIMAVLLVAGCARAPRAVEPAPVPLTPAKASGVLIGLTAAELGQRFGQPSFQVREGPGTKLQWSKNGCVIDVYLYPPEGGRGADRVTFADTRRPSGADISVEACLAFLAP